ncbi:MAG TPA: hypothetical protein VMF90_12030 [Rhizobiaceae bacterium]|nr:hypothetical protein [Rhizobiaceae bacterium]
MQATETLTIRCYRMVFGDVDVDDVSVSCSIFDAKQTARQRLLDEYHNDRFRSGDQLQAAALIAADGQVVATFHTRPMRPRGVQVVEV